MQTNDSRRFLSILASVLFINTLLSSITGSTAIAQNPNEAPSPFVKGLIVEVEQLRGEVRYLQDRDAGRQPWQASVEEQRSPRGVSMSTDNASPNPDVYAMEMCGGCNDFSCGSCKVCAYNFWNCKCPPEEAACIDCPRVSTLNPYFNLHVYGAAVGDMLFNEARPISPGAPYYLSPASPSGQQQHTVDIHGRSSFLAGAFTGPQVGCFQAGGSVMVYFYNDSVLADQYGILPTQFWGDLKNEDWRFSAGLQFDVFNPNLPTMLAFSALAGSGNAGNAWRGQLRAERFLYPCDDTQLTIQTALSEPIASVIDPSFRLLSEDNGWPNIEGRISLGLGQLAGEGSEAKRPFEIGCSGIIGEMRSTELIANRVVTEVWGAGGDIRWQINERFGLMGEVFTGNALGT